MSLRIEDLELKPCVKPYELTINDCLACSSCLTTEEEKTLLKKEDLKILDDGCYLLIDPHIKINYFVHFEQTSKNNYKKKDVQNMNENFTISKVKESNINNIENDNKNLQSQKFQNKIEISLNAKESQTNSMEFHNENFEQEKYRNQEYEKNNEQGHPKHQNLQNEDEETNAHGKLLLKKFRCFEKQITLFLLKKNCFIVDISHAYNTLYDYLGKCLENKRTEETLITSSCPATVKYIQRKSHKHLHNLLTVKTPQQLLTNSLKNNRRVVSITTCFDRKIEDGDFTVIDATNFSLYLSDSGFNFINCCMTEHDCCSFDEAIRNFHTKNNQIFQCEEFIGGLLEFIIVLYNFCIVMETLNKEFVKDLDTAKVFNILTRLSKSVKQGDVLKEDFNIDFFNDNIPINNVESKKSLIKIMHRLHEKSIFNINFIDFLQSFEILKDHMVLSSGISYVKNVLNKKIKEYNEIIYKPDSEETIPINNIINKISFEDQENIINNFISFNINLGSIIDEFFILRYKLFQSVEIDENYIEFLIKKFDLNTKPVENINKDMQVFKLEDNKKYHKFMRVFGLNNMTNVLENIDGDFIEIFTCSRSCINGPAQIKGKIHEIRNKMFDLKDILDLGFRITLSYNIESKFMEEKQQKKTYKVDW